MNNKKAERLAQIKLQKETERRLSKLLSAKPRDLIAIADRNKGDSK